MWQEPGLKKGLGTEFWVLEATSKCLLLALAMGNQNHALGVFGACTQVVNCAELMVRAARHRLRGSYSVAQRARVPLF